MLQKMHVPSVATQTIIKNEKHTEYINDIIAVTYCSKWHRLSLSLIAVNGNYGITLMAEP
jgi:hypothetical protein